MNATELKRLVFALLIATILTCAAWAVTKMPVPVIEPGMPVGMSVPAQILLIIGFPAFVVAFLLNMGGISSNAAFLIPFFLQWFGLAYLGALRIIRHS